MDISLSSTILFTPKKANLLTQSRSLCVRVHSHWAKANMKVKVKRIWWVYCTCYNCSELILFISDVIKRDSYKIGLLSKEFCSYLDDIVSVFKCEQHLLHWRNTQLDLNFVTFVFDFAQWERTSDCDCESESDFASRRLIVGYKAIFVIVIVMICQIAMWIGPCKCYAPIFSEIVFAITIAVCQRALNAPFYVPCTIH